MTYAEHLRELREAAGKTKADCSRHLRVTRQRYPQVENGGTYFSIAQTQKLCVFFHVRSHERWPLYWALVSETRTIEIPEGTSDIKMMALANPVAEIIGATYGEKWGP